MSDMLKITKLRLKNWKNFKAVEVDLQNRMFLVGPNASENRTSWTLFASCAISPHQVAFS